MGRRSARRGPGGDLLGCPLVTRGGRRLYSTFRAPLSELGSEPASWDWARLDAAVRPRLVGAAMRRFGFRHDEAEDLVQEVFEQVWIRRPRVRNPEAYLRTSLHHRCIDRRRQRRAETGADPLDEGLVGERHDRVLDAIAVKGAFRRLSPECRRFLKAYVVDDEPLARVAKDAQITVNAAWKRIDRCLKRMLQWLI